MKNANYPEEFLRTANSVVDFLKLFDLMPDVSFFLKDRQGRFIALNKRGCDYCGVRDAAEAFGKTDHDFFPLQRADAYHADDVGVMESDIPIINRLESAPEAEGSPRLVMTSKLPLHDAKGKVIGVFGLSRQVDRLRPSSGSAARFSKVVEHMHNHFGEPIATPSLAEMAGLSVSQFERRFHHAFGTSPRKYLIRIRIEASCRMLKETELTVAEIALECGFHDHAHFSRTFKSLVRQTPSEFKQSRG